MSVWTKPQYEDVRLGFEINLYVSNRQENSGASKEAPFLS